MNSTKLYVGNLAHEVSESDLAEFFSYAGEVVGAKIGMQRTWGALDTCGWVTMRDAESAARARQVFNGRHLCGQSLVVRVKAARRTHGRHNRLH